MRRRWYLWTGITGLAVIALAAVSYIALSPASQPIAAVRAAPPKIDRLKWKYDLADSTREFIDEELHNASFRYRTDYTNGYDLRELWSYPAAIIADGVLQILEQSSRTTIFELTADQVSAFETKHGRFDEEAGFTAAVNQFGDGIYYSWNGKVTALSLDGALQWCKLNPSAEQISLFEPHSGEMDPATNLAMNPVMGPMFAEGSDGLTRILTKDNCLIARDQNGNEVWRTPIEEDSPNSLWMFDFELGADNSVYLVSRAWQQIQAVGPAGDFRWKLYDSDIFPLGEEDDWLKDHYPNQVLERGMAGGNDGTAYVRSEGGSVAAIDYDGHVRWCYRPEEARGAVDYWVSAPVLGPDGSVYVRGEDGLIIGITPDGERKWAVKLPGGRETTRPVAGPDGTVYVISDATVYALEP